MFTCAFNASENSRYLWVIISKEITKIEIRYHKCIAFVVNRNQRGKTQFHGSLKIYTYVSMFLYYIHDSDVHSIILRNGFFDVDITMDTAWIL